MHAWNLPRRRAPRQVATGGPHGAMGLPSTEPTTVRPLFGGAITTELPERYVDVSDFRPVPDNQEVWTDASKDESVVVEIVERVAVGPSDDEGAAAWFFRDLAEVNGASASEILGVRDLSVDDLPSVNGPFAAASACVGRQVMSKGRDGVEAANVVEVIVANVRLVQVETDLLVTLNRALVVADGSQAAAQTGAGTIAEGFGGGGVDEWGPGWEVLRRVLASLRVEDWGLFG